MDKEVLNFGRSLDDMVRYLGKLDADLTAYRLAVSNNGKAMKTNEYITIDRRHRWAQKRTAQALTRGCRYMGLRIRFFMDHGKVNCI